MKLFFLCFTLFLSAYLWAAKASLENTSSVGTQQKFRRVTDVREVVDSSDCIQDILIYCDYNTNFSNNECASKASKACHGNPAAMREISESSKAKSLEALKRVGLI